MTKELQDLAWSVLPKEFKEEVKETYKEYAEKIASKSEPEYRIVGYIAAQTELELLFGIHNLTSDAEGEEMLTVPRKKVQEEYAVISKELSHRDTDAEDYIAWNYVKMTFEELFGSKCLPDEDEKVSKSTPLSEPKPAEPKFKRGDKVTVRANVVSLYPRPGIIIGQTDKPGQWIVRVEMADGDIPYKLSKSDLEPYTEPTDESRNLSQETANCDKHFDNILKDSFAEHNRLHIATEMAAAIIQSTDDITIDNKQVQKNLENVAKVAFLFADALIAESEKKGGNDGED